MPTTYSPYEHADREHIQIHTHPLADGMHGVWLPDARAILIQPGMPASLERCVLAHELAHYDLGHAHQPGGRSARHEAAADLLAAQRLIDPDELLTASADTDDAGRVALDLGVTPQLLRAWLHDLVRQRASHHRSEPTP